MYRLTASQNVVQRIADGALIPLPARESAGFEYEAWRKAGNAPQAYDAPALAVPVAVTPRQARLALLNAGRLSAVNAALASLPSPEKEAASITWEYANEIRRDDALLLALAAHLGLTPGDLDNLFIAASQYA